MPSGASFCFVLQALQDARAGASAGDGSGGGGSSGGGAGGGGGGDEENGSGSEDATEGGAVSVMSLKTWLVRLCEICCNEMIR